MLERGWFLIEWLATNNNWLSALAALIAVVLFVWGAFRALFRREPPRAVEPLPSPGQSPFTRQPRQGGETLDMEVFLRTQQKLRDELKAELEDAHAEDRARLQARIDELSRRIANPDKSLEDAQKRIADLEALLEREGNDIGAERLNEARAALEQGDYSLADDIFAEIEAREELAVQRAARAAFGRGEVAEAEVRWLDAAEHYSKAARLRPSYSTLLKASEYVGRAGNLRESIDYGERLASFARRKYGDSNSRTAIALNNVAGCLFAANRYREAEPLIREALEISSLVYGDQHPEVAIRLNNLAELLSETDRTSEAESIFNRALTITREVFGSLHPNTAVILNNLGVLLRKTGRFAESETMHLEALAITKSALGDQHPDTATDLKNLAILLHVTGRTNEAEPLFREALAIFESALGAEHSESLMVRDNLDALLASRS